MTVDKRYKIGTKRSLATCSSVRQEHRLENSAFGKFPFSSAGVPKSPESYPPMLFFKVSLSSIFVYNMKKEIKTGDMGLLYFYEN